MPDAQCPVPHAFMGRSSLPRTGVRGGGNQRRTPHGERPGGAMPTLGFDAGDTGSPRRRAVPALCSPSSALPVLGAQLSVLSVRSLLSLRSLFPGWLFLNVIVSALQVRTRPCAPGAAHNYKRNGLRAEGRTRVVCYSGVSPSALIYLLLVLFLISEVVLCPINSIFNENKTLYRNYLDNLIIISFS